MAAAVGSSRFVNRNTLVKLDSVSFGFDTMGATSARLASL
jgi:hypothetical protein